MGQFANEHRDLPTLDELLVAPITPREKLYILRRMAKHEWANLKPGEQRLLKGLVEDYQQIVTNQ